MSCEMKNQFVPKEYEDLYLNFESADVNFIFKNDGKLKIPAHKSILSAVSPVFNAMFFGGLREEGDVTIVDASPSAFKEFLQLFYLPKMTFTMANCEEVACLVDKYDAEQRFTDCAYNDCDESLNNLCWGLYLAIILHDEKLMQFYEAKICWESKTLFKSNTFIHCDQMVLKVILEMDFMVCEEIDVFNAVLSWAKSICKQNGIDENESNMRSQLGNCFHLIRFGAIDNKNLNKILRSYRDMFTSDELKEINVMKKSKETKTNFFKWKSRLIPPYHTDQEVTCWKVKDYNGWHDVNDKESAWFSADHPLALGKIIFQDVAYHRHPLLNINVIIVEFDELSFDANIKKRILYEGMVSIARQINLTLVLPQPILIYPHKMYEVCARKPKHEKVHHFATMNTEGCTLKEKVNVKFHQHPAETPHERRGLVSQFIFNIL